MEIKSIPTIYNGVQLRSRMEAKCAHLFDTLKWKWEYEPHSFMLPSGINYRPDFWIEELAMFVECRGYQTKDGNRQIEEFGECVQNQSISIPGGVPIDSYAAIISDSKSILWTRGTDHPVILAVFKCTACEKYSVNIEYCDFCEQPRLMRIISFDGGVYLYNTVFNTIEKSVLENLV